jgi:4'-phosphopantetheinyl transferase
MFETEVVCLRTADLASSVLANPHQLGLPVIELERWAQYSFEKDRNAFLAKRLLIRGALSSHVGIQPTELTFIENEYGKPALAAEYDADALHFNLSSTPQLAVCAISHQGAVGVDVEDDARSDALELVDWVLGPEEQRSLNRLPLQERAPAFLRHWTLKEAYVKARGIGVTLPLAEIQFCLTDGHSISASFGAELNDDPARWCFLQRRLFDQFTIAIALAS